MTRFLEKLTIRIWNRLASCRPKDRGIGLTLGTLVQDEQVTKYRAFLPDGKRTEHIAVLGRTGSGKSSLLKFMASQDIRSRRGFVFFDLHGDVTPALLSLIAAEERRTGEDLSSRVIVVEPADPDYSVGLNVLETRPGQQSFVQVSEFARILESRWNLSFGARTEELLRNSLLTLAECGQTILELQPLLTNPAFRRTCLSKVRNPEVRDYFESRYDQASDAQQSVFRDAVLNKISELTSDPHFRHILGQAASTFSLLDAIDDGKWVLLKLDKGRLGEHVLTLGSLFLTKLKNALFARAGRALFTLYCDEIQNLVAIDSSLDALLSEARKFGISIVSANQYLDQYPQAMRSAVLAVGTHIFFQLSSTDAEKIAHALDGGKPLAARLKNLPKRHLIVKSGNQPYREVRVPELAVPRSSAGDLIAHSRHIYARPRKAIEDEIAQRHKDLRRSSNEVLHEWD